MFGNEGRNAVEGPGYVNWDFSAFKNIRLTESREFQFRGELFNVLNHTNFRLPVSDIESPTFGQIQSDVSPSVVQVALKLLLPGRSGFRREELCVVPGRVVGKLTGPRCILGACSNCLRLIGHQLPDCSWG